jgi:hypothetical protein
LRPPRSVLGILAAVAAATAVLAGCHSSGTHLQSVAPASPSSVVSPASSATPASSSRSATSATPSSSQSVTQFPTPTVTPAVAQGAVNAYLAGVNAANYVDRDPAHVPLAKLDQYLTGDAKALFDSAFANMKKAGLAYRGTPDTPRVRVLAVISPTQVALSDCPMPSPTDPYTQYNVRTGRPVPVTTPTPPPPYRLLLNMTLVDGQWKLAGLDPDRSRTCTG